MRFSTVLTPVLLTSPLVLGYPTFDRPASRLARRASALFINASAQPPLPDRPTTVQKIVATTGASLSTDDIQGDILIGMKKRSELFYFFTIANPSDFKSKLGSVIHPLLTTTTQLLSESSRPQTMLNIAFSQKGLKALNVTDDLADADFTAGHAATAATDFRDQPGNWVEPLGANGDVHGVMLVASDSQDSISGELGNLEQQLGASIKVVYSLQGGARPGDQEGHEHFGYMDGISQPAITGFNDALPGQSSIAAGQIVVGEDGDVTSRPSWTKGGSFMVFRQLQQFVPEYNKFLLDNAIQKDNLTAQEGAELLGARMMGRWKSGAPVQLSPDHDDPQLGKDNTKNNDFDFSTSDSSKCPFAAHIRKTAPRGDIGGTSHMIIRAGIPYGPEVTQSESSSNKSDSAQERGLAFVSYQSNIGNGFKFLQKQWSNNANFVKDSPGLDAIIGSNGTDPFYVSGLDPTSPTKKLTVMTDFVISRGGEYFFAPSISAIANTLAK